MEVRNLPLEQLKYLDEVHIVPSHLLKGNMNFINIHSLGHRVWGPKGQKSRVISANSLGASFSLTALMSLNEECPIVLDIRTDSNTQVSSIKVIKLTLFSLTLLTLFCIFWMEDI